MAAVVPIRIAVTVLATAALVLAAAAPAGALTPTAGATYPAGVEVEGTCGFASGGVDTDSQFWMTTTIDPRRAYGGLQGGVSLAPESLPRLEVLGDGSPTTSRRRRTRREAPDGPSGTIATRAR